jgi:hypothetical protein
VVQRGHGLAAAALAVAVGAVSGCASLVTSEQDDRLASSDVATENDFKPVGFTLATGLAAYSFRGKPYKAQWLVCRGKKSARGAVVAVHRDRAGYEPAKFCSGWIAQAFLTKGLDVIAINRPGYGQSTGVPDFGGEQSMTAMTAGLADAVAKGPVAAPVTGLWASSSGTVAGGLFAKLHQGFKFAIFGCGIYDLEQTLEQTSDDYLKQDIAAIQKTGGTAAMESRSIGYDPSGMPPAIAIYHGRSDTSAPFGQAKAFADTLESAGSYKVTFQAVDGGQDLPWTRRRQVLELLLDSVAR